jgi:hypothetical protein
VPRSYIYWAELSPRLILFLRLISPRMMSWFSFVQPAASPRDWLLRVPRSRGDGRRNARGCGKRGVRGRAAGRRAPRRPLRVASIRWRVRSRRRAQERPRGNPAYPKLPCFRQVLTCSRVGGNRVFRCSAAWPRSGRPPPDGILSTAA